MPSRTGKASDAGSLRSEAPFPYKDRRAVEEAYDAEMRRMQAAGPQLTGNANYAQYLEYKKILDAKFRPIYKQELENRKAEKAAQAAEKAAAKAAKTDEGKRIAGIASGISNGLTPQRTALIDTIIKYRRQDYDAKAGMLERFNGELEKLFTKNGRTDYEKMDAWRRANQANLEVYKAEVPIVSRLTGLTRKDANGNVVMETVARYRFKTEPDTSTWHTDASRQATDIIDAFAAKIVAKTEEHAKIKDSKGEQIVGTPVVRSNQSDPWADSDITIETTHRKITWRTNMILNRSKLDTMFNQWPTRLVSDEAK